MRGLIAKVPHVLRTFLRQGKQKEQNGLPQRTPWGAWKKEGGGKLTNDTQGALKVTELR